MTNNDAPPVRRDADRGKDRAVARSAEYAITCAALAVFLYRLVRGGRSGYLSGYTDALRDIARAQERGER